MMKISTAIVVTTVVMFAGTVARAADDTLPCSKTQLWVTSLPTTPAAVNAHRYSAGISMASVVLQPRADTRIATLATRSTRL